MSVIGIQIFENVFLTVHFIAIWTGNHTSIKKCGNSSWDILTISARGANIAHTRRSVSFGMIDKIIENYKGVLEFTEKIRRNTMEIANYQTAWGRGAEICPYTAQTGLNSRLFCAARKFLTDLIQDNENHPLCRGNPAQGVFFVDAGVKNTFMRIDEKGIRRRTR